MLAVSAGMALDLLFLVLRISETAISGATRKEIYNSTLNVIVEAGGSKVAEDCPTLVDSWG